MVTWTDYICDFLELLGNAELSTHISTIRRGHYGLLDIHAKVSIFNELIAQALATDVMREKLDEYIEERQALAAKRRGEALEEGRKRRERKESAKAELNGKEHKDPSGSNSNGSVHHGYDSPNGDVAKRTSSARQKNRPESRF